MEGEFHFIILFPRLQRLNLETVFAWQYAQSHLSEAILDEFFGYHQQYEQTLMVRAGGMGLTIVGGGLALGGIVRMVVRR